MRARDVGDRAAAVRTTIIGCAAAAVTGLAISAFWISRELYTISTDEAVTSYPRGRNSLSPRCTEISPSDREARIVVVRDPDAAAALRAQDVPFVRTVGGWSIFLMESG